MTFYYQKYKMQAFIRLFLTLKQNKRTNENFLKDFFLNVYEAFTGTFLIGALQRVECKAKSNKKILVLTQYLKKFEFLL